MTGFVTAFCTVCVLTGGLYLICPQNRLERSVKYIFSLIFLLCTLTAIPQFADFKIKTEINSTVSSAESMNTQVICAVFEAALKNNNIEFSKITVCTDKNPDGGIIINRVTVYSSAPSAKVRDILGGDSASYDIEVISE